MESKKLDSPTDPADVGGHIEHEGAGSSSIHVKNAVILTSIDVANMVTEDEGKTWCMQLSGSVIGRVGKKNDHARVLFVMTPDGAAGICAELIGLAFRQSSDFKTAFLRRIQQLREEGNLTPAKD